MRISPPFWQCMQVAAAAGLMLFFVPACKPTAPAAAPAKHAAPKTIDASSGVSNAAQASVSVFEELMPPKGRDPFFPNSHRRDVQPVKGAAPGKPPPADELVLKGVVGSTSHRLALINDDIFEVGETGLVRVPSGHVQMRCVEIGEDYAVIQVQGQTQTKRLQLSKKGL